MRRWLLPTILLAGIRKKGTFRITDKKTEQGKNSSVGYALPYLAGVLLCMIAIVRLAGLSAREQTLTYSVILFWLCLNLYFQLLACYVAVGRERKADYTMQALTMQGSLKGEKEAFIEKWKDLEVAEKKRRYKREERGTDPWKKQSGIAGLQERNTWRATRIRTDRRKGIYL